MPPIPPLGSFVQLQARSQERFEQNQAEQHELHEGDWMVNNWLWKAAEQLVRSTSMKVTNDPRYFSSNVMERRLSAFKSLTLVSSIMFGTALKQCWTLKKDFNLEKTYFFFGDVGVVQLVSFFLALMVTVQCLLSLYIIAQQLFYTYRLMTAGSLGFEMASVFYLTRSITWWRHLAIKFLFNGLLKFLVFVGMQLFVQFFKIWDAIQMIEGDRVKQNLVTFGQEDKHTHTVKTADILNMRGGTAIATNLTHVSKPEHKLSMEVHVGLCYIVFVICTCASLVMCWVQSLHKKVFDENYLLCEETTFPIEDLVQEMSNRSTGSLET